LFPACAHPDGQAHRHTPSIWTISERSEAGLDYCQADAHYTQALITQMALVVSVGGIEDAHGLLWVVMITSFIAATEEACAWTVL
jgi:hypothetical protein